MQPREQFDTGVDVARNDAALKRAEPSRPGRLPFRTARSPAALLLVAFAAILALPFQAEAQTEGICGRTDAVQTVILRKISVSDCALVTDEHLAAIDQVNLSPGSTTALAAGDFDGLTSLTKLLIFRNILTTLPAGVFDELTSLTHLQLAGDSLTALLDGVFDNLTSLTQLELWGNKLTTLPDDVFDNLTSLTVLQLQKNSLTTLPAGIFDNLTSLTWLRLNNNGLTTLTAGVFDELTSLTKLDLANNDLTTLPDDVFEELTALTQLSQSQNPGTPFAPVAVALPDDGTVPIAGGTVTLDGSGSDGGPWGTNVTYRWALTAPTSGVTVTFDDATSAMPTVTIPALTAGAELTFTLTVMGRGDFYAPPKDTATLTAFDPNAAPAASDPSAPTASNSSVMTNEDTAYTFAASDFNFSDPDVGDALASVTVVTLPAAGTLALDGAVVTAGQSVPAADIGKLAFTSAANANGTGYASFTFKVSDGTNESASYTMTVNVTAVNDPATGAPTISGTAQVGETLKAATTGIADVDGLTSPTYGYQWIRVDGANETDIAGATSGAYTPVLEDVGKKVRVKVSFTDDDGSDEELTSAAYPAEEASVRNAPPVPNAAPSFTSSATFNAAENQAAVGTVQASDSDTDDSVTGYAIQGGADASKFSIAPATGVLTFASAPNFEAPADADTDNDYVVVVRATSGTGTRATTADQTITVTVTDVAGEAPGVPVAPTVSSASVTSVTATWTAPTNAGPAITDYDYQYRVKSPQGSWTEVTTTTITALGATITELAEDTEYEVQVRATNGEGTSGWSGSGSGSTDANASPSFTSSATFSAAENQTAVGTVQASDSDTGDSVTGYAIHGGADASKFSIVASTGVVTFASAPNFEAPADTDTDNGYVVVVRAMSGTGARATTADQTITVTVTDMEGEAPGVPVAPTVSSASVTSVTATWTAPTNASPSFTSSATFNAAENQAAVGTVQASDSDTDDSVTGYAIQGGADASMFSIVEATGVLTFASAPNFEAPADTDTDNGYVVVVRAMSGTGERVKTADQTITVTVTDMEGEAPGVPVAPTVSSASVTSLNVSWTAPANAGPAITDYDYRHRVTSPQGSWTEVTTTTITALSATITQLTEDTEYEVQVRATNDEGTSGWSGSGSGSTDANASPSFTSPARFNAAENQTAVGTVQASDSDTGDSVTGYAIQGGADASKFSIVASTGALTFASAPNFEAPADTDTDNGYVVVVRAMSGTGERVKTADQTITVTVTDMEGEAPGVPAAPLVSSASVTSVTAAWTAPANAGPPITDYDYRHRVTLSQGSWTEVTTTTITALSATITQLTEDTEYDVQVRATNDEGTSGWSGSGTGTPTGSTEAGAIANAPENLQATAGNAEVTLRWDAPNNDSGADITGYAYRYKESGGDFIAYTDIPESGPGEANARSYTVTELTNGLEYVFHVRALNQHGGGLPAEATVTLPGIVSSESEELPAEVTLSTNYPNPFNPETTIRYALPQAGEVRLVVYDLLGHEVAVLVDQSRPAGNHTVRFGAGNLSSGLYVYRLQAQDKTIVRTMMLVK